MNGKPASIEITGMVLGLDASGIGPNSGEITFVIKTDAGPVVEVFAGILGSSNPSADGIEQGVYASFVTIALTAMTTGRSLRCSYLPLDKYRVYNMSIRS
jgi:hypothetical protein